MNLDEMLARAVDAGASDIHLKVGQPPMMRVDGAIGPMTGAPTLSTDDLTALLQVAGSAAPHRLATFRDTGELDASYETDQETRFRVNAFRQRGSISIALRFIPRSIPSFEDLHMPPGHPSPRRDAPWARARHGRHRRRQVDHACGDGAPHQQDTQRAHRHDRRSDRGHPSRTKAASSTSVRSESTRDRSAKRCGARCGRTRTPF